MATTTRTQDPTADLAWDLFREWCAAVEQPGGGEDRRAAIVERARQAGVHRQLSCLITGHLAPNLERDTRPTPVDRRALVAVVLGIGVLVIALAIAPTWVQAAYATLAAIVTGGALISLRACSRRDGGTDGR